MLSCQLSQFHSLRTTHGTLTAYMYHGPVLWNCVRLIDSYLLILNILTKLVCVVC